MENKNKINRDNTIPVGLKDWNMINSVAHKLAKHHKQDPEQTLLGLLAEFAAILHFNYHLGATNPLALNTTYTNGGDGGIDFRVGAMTFDAKLMKQGKLETDYCKNSRADIIVCMTSGGYIRGHGEVFQCPGWIPKSRINFNKKFLEKNQLRPTYLLAKRFEILFNKPFRPVPKPDNSMLKVGELVGRAVTHGGTVRKKRSDA